ncbi:MAG TPA: NUDIX hydrolase [Jiangellaceae bacterium]|nr:NUDIX hydrolase [Jiangellaceae bacterium]
MRGLQRTDGDGWVDCICGQRHWGRFGAAGLMVVDPDDGVLLQHRASWSHHGDTWGVPGGARASTESALAAALREAHEEAAVSAPAVRPSHAWVEDHGPWSYTTVVARRVGPLDPHPSDPESREIRWVAPAQVSALPLLPAFGRLWPQISDQIGRALVLVVDAANVVGSRPDGWWRDRIGATARLRDELAVGLTSVPSTAFGLPATTWWPQVRLVTEGQARSVESVEGVDVLAAPASGDDAVVAAVAEALAGRPDDHVVAVTADRELRSRVLTAGGRAVGPSTLWSVLRCPVSRSGR